MNGIVLYVQLCNLCKSRTPASRSRRIIQIHFPRTDGKWKPKHSFLSLAAPPIQRTPTICFCFLYA